MGKFVQTFVAGSLALLCLVAPATAQGRSVYKPSEVGVARDVYVPSSPTYSYGRADSSEMVNQVVYDMTGGANDFSVIGISVKETPGRGQDRLRCSMKITSGSNVGTSRRCTIDASGGMKNAWVCYRNPGDRDDMCYQLKSLQGVEEVTKWKTIVQKTCNLSGTTVTTSRTICGGGRSYDRYFEAKARITGDRWEMIS